MKILFVISSYSTDGAGAGMSVRYLAEGVLKKGHQPVVMRLSRDNHYSESVENGVKIYHLPMRNIYTLRGAQRNVPKRLVWHMIDMFNPWAAWDFYKILKKEKPDVINTSVVSGFSTSLFYVAKMAGVPLVHTMRDYYLMCPQNAMFKNGKNCETVCAACRPFKMVRTLSGRCVDMYLTNSEFVARHHKKFKALPAGKPCYTQFNMNADDVIAPPRKFPAGKKIVFGFIGRITETKGIEILLKAAQGLENDNWEIRIGGTGYKYYTDSLQQKFPDKRIVYQGHVDSGDFYGNIDILVCPSLYEEPLPRVVYEAYKAALPVIAARTGGTPEIVDDGETGFVYDARDTKKLAEHMNRLSSEPQIYEAMSRGAACKAEMFTASAISSEFISKLEEVLQGDA